TKDAFLTAQAPEPPPDPWKGRQKDAIQLVKGQPVPGTQRSVGDQAQRLTRKTTGQKLLDAIAAQQGTKFSPPVKVAWSASQQEGARYVVTLNVSALNAAGERVPARMYRFTADLEKNQVESDDVPTKEVFLTAQAPEPPPDPWKDRQDDAVRLVKN